MSGGDRIFTWDAGPGSGAVGDREDAFEAAEAYVLAGHEGTVKEAVVSLCPVGHGGAVSQHVPTGRAWRGCLAGGEPAWSQVAERAGEALAGGAG